MILRDEAQDVVDAVTSLHREATEKLIRALAEISAKNRMIASLQAKLAESEERVAAALIEPKAISNGGVYAGMQP